MMEQNLNVVDLISSLLDSEKYKEALSVAIEEKYSQCFKDNCWDLISIIVIKIQNDTMILKPSLYGTCEELLSIIVQKATPEEALLEFIEQIEVAKNDAQFGIILDPLQKLLLKLTVKRGRSLEWCLNSISTYVENIDIPEHQLEEKERLLMDCDNNIRRIIKICSLLPPFYGPFVKEVVVSNTNQRTREILAAFLISLLGKPLLYMDLDPDSNANSEARICANIFAKDICSLVKNIFKFLNYVELLLKQDQKKKPENAMTDIGEEQSPYDHIEKINITTVSSLFYVILSGHFEIPDSAVPLVYSSTYVMNTVLLCVVHLLSFVQYSPLAKGISLCKYILNSCHDIVNFTVLSNSVHYSLCKILVSVSVYCGYENIRKDAVKLIESHVNKFDYKGRCMLIKYMLETANHSGVIGFAITLYKNSINKAFQETELPECFVGLQLMSMVKKICYLPHGAESDLVELADQIITALNFLRYLALKDRFNKTGIREHFQFIEDNYLKSLRTGINMSKAHYEVKLKDIEAAKVFPDAQVDVTINVGGNVLDQIPAENKKQIILSALNAFHLIEGLLARLSECIVVNKINSTNSVRTNCRLVVPLPVIPISNLAKIIRNYCQVPPNKDIAMQKIITEHEENQYEEDVKKRILTKALQFVPKSGWSIDSLAQGAEAAGYPGIAHGLFPNGGGDLVHYFNVNCNERLVNEMKNWPKDANGSKIPVQQIENAIIARLSMIDPYKSTWPKAMAIQTLPNNVPNCLATLLSLVDDICYHTGDRSVDFNWYIRRVGLAGIYKASELFYLTDTTQNCSGTRNFVKSRIRDAAFIQTALNMNPVSVAPQTLTAAFVTAKNMLGMNTVK